MKAIMTKRSYAVLVLLSVVAAVPAFAEHTRVTNPSAVSVEALGRGLMYSVNFDRVLSDELAAGIGFGTVPTKFANGMDASLSASMLPAYFNYYFMKEQGSVFATGGVTIVLNSGDVSGKTANTSGLDFSSRAVLPSFGLGYENRSDAGYLFRLTAYGIVGDKVIPWAGISFGYSF